MVVFSKGSVPVYFRLRTFRKFFGTLPMYSPLKTKLTFVEKLDALEDEADSFPAKKSGSFEKGDIFLHTFPGAGFFRYLFTIGPWSVNGGRSHPIRPPIFGEHNSTSALGEVVRVRFQLLREGGRGGEDPVFGPTSTSLRRP